MYLNGDYGKLLADEDKGADRSVDEMGDISQDPD